jgi:hypothetical protein
MVREDDPFHLRWISLRLYNAFHELYESLSFESQGCSFAMGREEDRLRVGDDPEVLILRMRQYQKAAHVVNAMRIVLEKGPDASLDEPFQWAQTITGYNPPINPDRKLAPQKDFILSTVTGLMLEHAPPDVSNLNEGEKLKVAGRVLAEEALNLKQDLRSRRRRGEQAEQVIGGRIGDLAQRIALLRLSPYAKPALDATDGPSASICTISPSLRSRSAAGAASSAIRRPPSCRPRRLSPPSTERRCPPRSRSNCRPSARAFVERGENLLAFGLPGRGTTHIVCAIGHELHFTETNRFADFLVHEAAHVFHNCKRRTIGLPGTRYREWLLDIEFRKRETFAYACEVYSRVLELAPKVKDRPGLIEECAANFTPGDERVDSDELADILCEAARARNGWKHILGRCAPPRRERRAARAAVGVGSPAAWCSTDTEPSA